MEMECRDLLIGLSLILGVSGCHQSDTGVTLPQPLQVEPSQTDLRRLEVYAAIAEQYLHSGRYHIEYTSLPSNIYGQAWGNQLEINTDLITDQWELASTVTHEMCHAGQSNQGRWGLFDSHSAYEDRWQEIECKSIELGGATYIFTTLGLEVSTIPQNWEDYYFHTKLLTNFYGKENIRYYPETYITTWIGDTASNRPNTFIQE